MTTQIVSPQIDYASKQYSHPSPLYVKITPTSGTTSPTLSITSAGTLSEFQVPAKVVNLAQSYLSFDLSLASAGVSLVNAIQGNGFCTINRIVVSTIGSNVVLADISNLGNYCEAVCPHSTKIEDLLDKSNGWGTMTETSLALSRQNPIEDITRCARGATGANFIGQLSTATTGGDDDSVHFTGYRHLYSQPTQATACFVSMRLPLGGIKNTIMAIDKDMYFGGEMLNIAIYWEAQNKWNFGCTAITAPSTGEVVPATVATMANLAFYASCEQNVSITSAIIERVNTVGLSLPVPLIWSAKYNIGATTSHSITQNITRSYGNKLLFVAWAPFNNTETLSTQKSHTTYLHTLYNTYLNQVPIISNSGVDVTLGEHWTYNKPHIDKSAIQNQRAYNNCFTHFDNFTGKSLPELNDSLTEINGIDLTAEQQQWQLNATTSSVQLNHYVFWCCQKQLTISNAGVSLM